jgi:hypothetical protein
MGTIFQVISLKFMENALSAVNINPFSTEGETNKLKGNLRYNLHSILYRHINGFDVFSLIAVY